MRSHSHIQIAHFCLVKTNVLLEGLWLGKTSGAGMSVCTGEGGTFVEVPSSPLAGSSLLLTALLSKTQGVKIM